MLNTGAFHCSLDDSIRQVMEVGFIPEWWYYPRQVMDQDSDGGPIVIEGRHKKNRKVFYFCFPHGKPGRPFETMLDARVYAGILGSLQTGKCTINGRTLPERQLEQMNLIYLNAKPLYWYTSEAEWLKQSGEDLSLVICAQRKKGDGGVETIYLAQRQASRNYITFDDGEEAKNWAGIRGKIAVGEFKDGIAIMPEDV